MLWFNKWEAKYTLYHCIIVKASNLFLIPPVSLEYESKKLCGYCYCCNYLHSVLRRRKFWIGGTTTLRYIFLLEAKQNELYGNELLKNKLHDSMKKEFRNLVCYILKLVLCIMHWRHIILTLGGT